MRSIMYKLSLFAKFLQITYLNLHLYSTYTFAASQAFENLRSLLV